MIIHLPHVSPIDTVKPPENLEEIVTKSFQEFTKGTADAFTYHDKLQYLDNLRTKYIRDRNSNGVKDLILEQTEYEIIENNDFPDKEDFWCYDFMCTCYDKGIKNTSFCQNYEPDHHANENTMLTILQIITTVINYKNS